MRKLKTALSASDERDPRAARGARRGVAADLVLPRDDLAGIKGGPRPVRRTR
jgi:hypothetical protein